MNFSEFLKTFGIKKEIETHNISRVLFKTEKALLAHQPIYSGECIAHQRGDTFIPSTTFLQQIGKEARKHVILTPKAEWLFTCGRDIFAKGIVTHNNPAIGDRVVILNQHKECLGYCDMIAPLDAKRVIFKRLFDIGDLLRRERKSRKVRV